ncbi:hypothetical protein B0H19DRAFT_1094357 [Mycena capillaripes]|nr:hypothetical protein B0H19DRAFT_1094357 [Mycena capillaripes]
MKRGAERQISKDDDDQEVEEVSGDGAFQKADNTVLATRKIKAMPRRPGGSPSLAASSSESAIVNGAAENSATSTPTKFSSFSGFGTPGSSGNAFSLFGPTPGTPTPSTLFSGAPAVSSTASNAAKTFASFLGDPSSKPAANPAPPAPPQNPSSASTKGDDAGEEATLKYYSSLRGLNVSILAAITKAIDQDPFTDVASLLSRYNSLRVDVQKEYDDRAKSSAPARSSAPSPSPFGAPPVPAPTLSAPAAPLKMPAAPAVFAGFGKPTSSAAPKTNGLAEAPPLANPFAFPASTSTSTTPKPSPFAPTTSPFGPSPSTSAFGSPPASSFFGSGASTNAFGSAASPSPFSSSSKPSTSLFGSGGGFGSPSPFGNKGSIGNPVGFSFASPKAEEKKGEDAPAKGDEDADGEGDGGANAEAGSSQETDKASTPGATTDEGSTASAMLFGHDTPTGLDAEGEGEEDEETVKSERIKAYRMRKKEEGGDGGWLDIGVGFLRLKKHKETSARRLLLRNSNSGKIQINFALYSGLKASQSKKSLTFIGHDTAGEPQTYSLRFRTEEAAKEFQVALDKEIAQIKAA